MSAWLVFYVHAQSSQRAKRLLNIYSRRLNSNLTHALRPLSGERAEEIAEGIAALIDGLYIRAALAPAGQYPVDPVELVESYVDRMTSGG